MYVDSAGVGQSGASVVYCDQGLCVNYDVEQPRVLCFMRSCYGAVLLSGPSKEESLVGALLGINHTLVSYCNCKNWFTPCQLSVSTFSNPSRLIVSSTM